ncbi:MAG: hypothetical protein WA849_18060 [Candidatus Udaeobacter sp.]
MLATVIVFQYDRAADGRRVVESTQIAQRRRRTGATNLKRDRLSGACICADALVGPDVTVDDGAILGAGGDRVEGRETVDDCC